MHFIFLKLTCVESKGEVVYCMHVYIYVMIYVERKFRYFYLSNETEQSEQLTHVV